MGFNFSCLETIHHVILGHGPYINGLIGQKSNMYCLALTRAEDISRVCATVPLFMEILVKCSVMQNTGRGLGHLQKKKKKILLPDKHSIVWGQRLEFFD